MSWTSGTVPTLVGGEEFYWSTRAAAIVLDCPIRMIRELVREAGLAPAGKRHEPGFGTRHVPVYEAAALLRVWENAVAGNPAELF